MSPFDYVLLYGLHTAVWFCLGSLSSVVRGSGGAMSIMSSSAIALFSFTAHNIFNHLYLSV